MKTLKAIWEWYCIFTVFIGLMSFGIAWNLPYAMLYFSLEHYVNIWIVLFSLMFSVAQSVAIYQLMVNER